MLEHWVDTRVGRLRVCIEGKGSSQPTALLWHSLFVDERSWGPVVPELAQDRQLILVTGPGHGRSGDPGHRYSMEDCAEAALEVLRAEAIEGPVDWVGNAWGGHVGILVASLHPERIRTLITAGAPVHAYALAGRLSTHLLLLLYRWLGPTPYLSNAVVEALLSEHSRATNPSAVGLVRDGFTGADRAAMINAVISISLNRRDLAPLLPRVLAPTLFITGSEHPDWSPEHMRSAAALLPHGTCQVIDQAAYLVPLEAPADFGHSVREFWAAHLATNG